MQKGSSTLQSLRDLSHELVAILLPFLQEDNQKRGSKTIKRHIARLAIHSRLLSRYRPRQEQFLTSSCADSKRYSVRDKRWPSVPQCQTRIHSRRLEAVCLSTARASAPVARLCLDLRRRFIEKTPEFLPRSSHAVPARTSLCHRTQGKCLDLTAPRARLRL